jgi:predicted peptidase
MPQQAHAFDATITKPVRLNYLIYLPKGYGENPDEKWPFILFLHGMGERGDDLELVKKHGIPKLLDTRDDFPFVVISPQCPPDGWWGEEVDALNALLDEALANYAIDPKRVYLTGMSMGGYGAWQLASLYPERFAAVVPICGGGNPAAASRLKDVPVWAFHGAKDAIVLLSESEKMVAGMRAVGGNVRFTVYPEADHDSWTLTYDNPELYEWLLQQRR